MTTDPNETETTETITITIDPGYVHRPDEQTGDVFVATSNPAEHRETIEVTEKASIVFTIARVQAAKHAGWLAVVYGAAHVVFSGATSASSRIPASYTLVCGRVL